MCLKLSVPPVPVLPDPLTLGIGVLTPPVSFNPTICCRFPILTIPPIPLGVALPPISTAAITGYVTSVLAYLDQFQFTCPLE